MTKCSNLCNFILTRNCRHYRSKLQRLQVQLYLSAYSSNSTKYLSSIHQYKPSSSTEALSSLPDVIESNCLNWENALQSKLNNQNSRWFPSKLKCSDVFVYGKTTKLILTTGKVETTQRSEIDYQLFPSMDVELRLFREEQQNAAPLNFPIFGVVTSKYKEGFSIKLDRTFDNPKFFKNKYAQIRLCTRKGNNAKLQFLRARTSLWEKMPGFETFCYAFKCNKTRMADPELDPVDLLKDSERLNQAEQSALAAALNMQRTLVSVHARPSLLPKYLANTTNMTSCPRIVVICPHVDSLCRTICQYYYQIGDGCAENFVCFKTFHPAIIRRHAGAVSSSADALLDLIARRTIGFEKVNLQKDICRQDYNILFITAKHSSLLHRFISDGDIQPFDAAVLEEADAFTEADTWNALLPLSRNIRLFGEYNLTNKHTAIQHPAEQQQQQHKSLLQRLDESFGGEVNFHVRRQQIGTVVGGKLEFVREAPNKVRI